MMVQYIKFLFPRGSFEEEAFLNNLRFIYDWGLDTDASENPIRE
jgi:hypothetical protein